MGFWNIDGHEVFQKQNRLNLCMYPDTSKMSFQRDGCQGTVALAVGQH